MTPLMPVIFIVSAVVSGIAFCMLDLHRHHGDPEAPGAARKTPRGRATGHGARDRRCEVGVVRITASTSWCFLVLAISLELLDVVFRSYTAVKSWDVVESAVYGREFRQVFVLQYGLGNLVP